MSGTRSVLDATRIRLQLLSLCAELDPEGARLRGGCTRFERRGLFRGDQSWEAMVAGASGVARMPEDFAKTSRAVRCWRRLRERSPAPFALLRQTTPSTALAALFRMGETDPNEAAILVQLPVGLAALARLRIVARVGEQIATRVAWGPIVAAGDPSLRDDRCVIQGHGADLQPGK